MNQPFNVTCYRNDVGIFTVYGARVKQNKITEPYPYKAINNIPVPRDPRFIDTVYYEVVLFTNEELTQSFSCYRSKHIYKAENYLNNFIALYSRGIRYIDLSRIPDYPLKPSKPYYPPCPPRPLYNGDPCFYTNDKFDRPIPDWEIDPRYLGDPRTNPYYDVFENLSRDPRYAKGPKDVPLPPPVYGDIDLNKQPLYDGEVQHFRPEPLPPIKPDCPLPPPCPCPPLPPCPCPPPPPYYPPYKEKICIYYGDGGFSMGESAEYNIKSLAPNALRVLLRKNYGSTYPMMNPADHILVKKAIVNMVNPNMIFRVNMSVAGEWAFFMIPDMYYRMVETFNWYYKEDIPNGQWKELDKSYAQTAFVRQDNGIRYFVNAIRLNGRYDLRFAMTGRDLNDIIDPPDTPDNPDIDDMKYVISIFVNNFKTNKLSATVEDLSVTNQVIRNLKDFINDEIAWQAIENHVYELKIYSENDKVNPLIVKYFIAIPDTNYSHGFCTWMSDSYDSTQPISTQFHKTIELDPPSATDKIVINP